jgi:protein-tyrosine phosphatase
MGCPIQVTAGSFLGRFGPTARAAAEQLLAERIVHLVASDAHDTEKRPPRLSDAREWMEKNHGAELAQALFVDNPHAVVSSQALPYFPGPAQPKKKRFWFF